MGKIRSYNNEWLLRGLRGQELNLTKNQKKHKNSDENQVNTVLDIAHAGKV